MRNLAILVLLGLLFWFGKAIVRLENYHYASQIGMCGNIDLARLVERDKCLNSIETRTSAFWHLYYALLSP